MDTQVIITKPFTDSGWKIILSLIFILYEDHMGDQPTFKGCPHFGKDVPEAVGKDYEKAKFITRAPSQCVDVLENFFFLNFFFLVYDVCMIHDRRLFLSFNSKIID